MYRKKTYNFGFKTASFCEKRLVWYEYNDNFGLGEQSSWLRYLAEHSEPDIENKNQRGNRVDVYDEKIDDVIGKKDLEGFLGKLKNNTVWTEYISKANYHPEKIANKNNPYLSHLMTSQGVKYALNFNTIERTLFGLRVVVNEQNKSKANASKAALEAWHGSPEASERKSIWETSSFSDFFKPIEPYKFDTGDGDSSRWAQNSDRDNIEKIPIFGYLVGKGRHMDNAIEQTETSPTKVTYDFKPFEYVALVWPNIEDGVKRVFDDDRIPTNVREKVLGHVGVVPKFDDLIVAMALSLKTPGKDEKIRKNAIAALKDYMTDEVGADLLKISLTKKAAHLAGGKAAREELAMFIKDYSPEYDPQLEAKHPVNEALLRAAKFDVLRGTVRRRHGKINAESWRPLQKQGLASMAYYWKHLDIPIKDAPIKAILNQLAKASDDKYLKKQQKNHKGQDVGKWFQYPDEYRAQIMGCDNGGQFMKAWDHYKSIRAAMMAEDLAQEASEVKIGELEGSPLLKSVQNGIKTNAKALTSALKRGDYATAGMYIGGLVALLHVIKMHDADGKFMKKWGSYAVLAYAGVKVLEKAGVPVSKHLGIEDAFSELGGTNMMKSLTLAGITGFTKIDPKVYLIASKFKISDLYREYMGAHHESNTELGWIDPRKFPYYRKRFPLASGTLTDQRKANNEYDHVGKELYKLTISIRNAYERFMYNNPEAGRYHRFPFESTFVDDPLLKDAHVEEFLAAIIVHSQGVDVDSSMVTSIDGKLRTMLDGVKPGLSPKIDHVVKVAGRRVAGGRIMGIPVVVLFDGEDGYKIFNKAEYVKKKGAGATLLATLPSEKKTLKEKLTAELGRLTKDVSMPMKGVNKIPAVWDGSSWTVEHGKDDGDKYKDFGVRLGKARTATVNIDARGGVKVENMMDPEKALLQAMLGGKNAADFSALKPFVDAGLVRVGEPKKTKNTKTPYIELSIDGINLPKISQNGRNYTVPTLNYTKANGFRMGPKSTVALMKSSQFQAKYAELMIKNGSPELNATVARLIQKVESADESIFENAATGGNVLTGSIAGNRTKSAVSAIKYAMMQKFKHAARQASDIKTLSHTQSGDLILLNTELQGVITKLENRQGTWTESDYSRDVLSGVYSSLPGSSAYTETFLSIERELYKKGGFYETTDLSNKFHLDVERKMKKFSEYAVDGGAYVYMDGRTVEVGNIDLDNLNAKPSTPSSTIAKQWEDPAYRGWYMLKYNEYVLDRVMGSPSNSVDNFDVWAANNTITQQEITDMAPYEHANADAEHQKTPPTYTKLDKAIIKAFEDAVDDLERDIPEFEAQKARDFLTATGVSARSTGILAVYVKNGTNYSKLFGMSSSVSQKTTKKAQQLVIRNLVERRLMRNEILANPDAYFADSVSWTQELKMKYPGIIKWPIIGSLIK